MNSRGGVDAAVEVDRGDDRLEAVGEDRVFPAAAGLLLAAAEQHEAAEVDVSASRVNDAAETIDAFTFDL